jgi:hypothetical protein
MKLTKDQFLEYFRLVLARDLPPEAIIRVENGELTTVYGGMVKIGRPVECPGAPYCPDTHCTGWVMGVVSHFAKPPATSVN